MDFEPLRIPEVVLVKPKVFGDARGFFLESWQDRKFAAGGLDLRFVQDIPMSRSHPSYAALAAVEEGLGHLSHLPTTLIWGEKDWVFTPHFLARFQRFFPQAEVQRLAWAGHLVAQDASPEVIAFLKEFIS